MRKMFLAALAASISSPTYAEVSLDKQAVQARHEVCLRFAFTATDLFRPGDNLPPSDVLYLDCILHETSTAEFQTTPDNAQRIIGNIEECGGHATMTASGYVTINDWHSLNCFETVGD